MNNKWKERLISGIVAIIGYQLIKWGYELYEIVMPIMTFISAFANHGAM